MKLKPALITPRSFRAKQSRKLNAGVNTNMHSPTPIYRGGTLLVFRTVPILFLFLTFFHISRSDPVFAFGNQFILNGTQDAASLDTMSKKDSLRFTAQKTKNVNQLQFLVGTSPGVSQYRVGIQGNIPSDNNPNGVFLSSNSVTISGPNWRIVNIPLCQLSAGTTYHIVIEPISVGADFYIKLRAVDTPTPKMNPYDFTPDSAMSFLYNSTGSWIAQSYMPLYIIRYDDLTYQGVSYSSFSIAQVYNSAPTSNYYQGEIIKTTYTATVTKLGFYIFKQSSPSLPLEYEIDNVDTGLPIETDIFALPGDVPGELVWREKSKIACGF